MRTANSDQTGHLFSLGVQGIMLVLSRGGSIKRSPRSATYKDRTQTTHLALFSLRTESDNPDATCELIP